MFENTRNSGTLSLDNTLNNATKIGTLNGTKTFAGSVSKSDLQDYYSFHLNSASPLNLSLQGTKGDADVQLLDRSGKYVASSTGTGTDEIINLSSLSAGDYYLRVYKGETIEKLIESGDLSQRASISLRWSKRWNQQEQEPVAYTLKIANSQTAWLDDTFRGATNLGALNNTVSIQNSVSSSDLQDYYRFHVDVNHPFFNLSLKGFSGNADVQLLGRGGDLIASSTRIGNDESINLSNLFAGDYYVRVYKGDTPTKLYESQEISPRQRWQLIFGQNGQQSISYTLQMSSDRPSNLLPIENDIGTLNSTHVLSGNLSDKNTADIYRFNLGSDSRFNAVLTGLNHDANLRLILDKNNNGILDPGEEVSRSAQTDVHDEFINVAHLAAGSYFMQIYNNSMENTSYTLRMSNASPNNLLFNENNVGNLQGTRIFKGSISNSNPSDLYSFSLASESQGFNITLSGLGNDADVQLIRDVNGNGIVDGNDVINSSRNTGSAAELIRQALTPGQYFVQVNQFGTAATSYNLGISTGDFYSNWLRDAGIIGQARTFAADGVLDRNDMIALFRESEDLGRISAEEFTDFRHLLGHNLVPGEPPTVATNIMPDYVRALADKVVSGDPANDRSGIGNLNGSSSSSQMEQLIGKWFLGIDRPVAISYNETTQYSYQYVSGSLFQNGISYLDIHQQDLGDCYFLASLGSVALRTPEVIENMFIPNGDNTYTVRFFHDGTPDYVTVDQFLPTSAGGGAVFAGWGGSVNTDTSNELWIALAEKAYAQINQSGWIRQDNTNSYNGYTLSSISVKDNGGGLNGGQPYDSLHHVTGRSTASRSVDRRTLGIGKEDVGRIADAAVNGAIVILNTKSSGLPSDGVPGAHSYTLVSYDSSSERFTLYNPWGHEHSVDRGELLNNFSSWDFVTA